MKVLLSLVMLALCTNAFADLLCPPPESLVCKINEYNDYVWAVNDDPDWIGSGNYGSCHDHPTRATSFFKISARTTMSTDQSTENGKYLPINTLKCVYNTSKQNKAEIEYKGPNSKKKVKLYNPNYWTYGREVYECNNSRREFCVLSD